VVRYLADRTGLNQGEVGRLLRRSSLL